MMVAVRCCKVAGKKISPASAICMRTLTCVYKTVQVFTGESNFLRSPDTFDHQSFKKPARGALFWDLKTD